MGTGERSKDKISGIRLSLIHILDFFFDTPVEKIQVKEDGYLVSTKDAEYACKKCIVSVGRSGSK